MKMKKIIPDLTRANQLIADRMIALVQQKLGLTQAEIISSELKLKILSAELKTPGEVWVYAHRWIKQRMINNTIM